MLYHFAYIFINLFILRTYFQLLNRLILNTVYHGRQLYKNSQAQRGQKLLAIGNLRTNHLRIKKRMGNRHRNQGRTY